MHRGVGRGLFDEGLVFPRMMSKPYDGEMS